MKKIQLKPLLLTIPFIALLIAFNFLDYPIEAVPIEDVIPESTGVQAPVVIEEDEEETEIVSNSEGEVINPSVEETVVTDPSSVETAVTDTTVATETPVETPTTQAVAEITRKNWVIGLVETDWNKSTTMNIVIGNVGDLEDEKSGTPIFDEPNEYGEQIHTLQYRAAIELDSDQSARKKYGYYRVKLINDKNGHEAGYVKAEDVILMTIPIGAPSKLRRAIIKDAMSYRGLKFVQYGKSLTEGTDCSNFITLIYAQHGITLPDKPNDIAASGYEVSDEDAKPGDIVYYYKANNKYGHVGIYLGNGMILNSSGHSGKKYPEGGVRMCTVVYPDRKVYKMINVIDK